MVNFHRHMFDRDKFFEIIKKDGRYESEILREAGLSFTFFVFMRKRNSVPNISTLKALAEALNCSIDDFITVTDEKSRTYNSKFNIQLQYHTTMACRGFIDFIIDKLEENKGDKFYKTHRRELEYMSSLIEKRRREV